MPNLITENVTSFRNPETLADLVSGLKSKVTRDSVVEPGFLSSLLAKKGTPIDYDNLASLIGGRLRQAVVDPVRGYGEAVHKGMTGQPLTLGDLAAITELNMDVGVGGGFLSGLRHGVRPNIAQSFPAFHGSPHKIKGGFKDTAIGTGEGAAAFGHGHYFTDKKEIAEGYAKALSHNIVLDKGPEVKIDGVKVTAKPENLMSGVALLRSLPPGTTKGKAIKIFTDNVDTINKGGQHAVIGTLEQNKKALSVIENSNSFDVGGGKHIYETTIHKGKSPDEYSYLRWDKDMDADTLDKVAGMILKDDKLKGDIGFKQGVSLGEIREKIVNFTGQDVYSILAGAKSDKEASKFLLKAGIDGIKYPAGTRSGGNVDDAFNYVVFDPREITIEKHFQDGVLQ